MMIFLKFFFETIGLVLFSKEIETRSALLPFIISVVIPNASLNGRSSIGCDESAGELGEGEAPPTPPCAPPPPPPPVAAPVDAAALTASPNAAAAPRSSDPEITMVSTPRASRSGESSARAAP